jgi:hypothetical protein
MPSKGKKWFAFSKVGLNANVLLKNSEIWHFENHSCGVDLIRKQRYD